MVITTAMGRYNGNFRYIQLQALERDSETGYYSASGTSDWVDGGECQIERSIPAKERIGDDGKTYTYNYSVFIPATFGAASALGIGVKMEITTELGDVDTFTIQGVDRNRKYVEVWG